MVPSTSNNSKVESMTFLSNSSFVSSVSWTWTLSQCFKSTSLTCGNFGPTLHLGLVHQRIESSLPPFLPFHNNYYQEISRKRNKEYKRTKYKASQPCWKGHLLNRWHIIYQFLDIIFHYMYFAFLCNVHCQNAARVIAYLKNKLSHWCNEWGQKPIPSLHSNTTYPLAFLFPLLTLPGWPHSNWDKISCAFSEIYAERKEAFLKTSRNETCFLIFKNPSSSATAKFPVYYRLVKVRIKFPVFLCHGHPHYIIDLLNIDWHLPEKL